ncbi:MAG: hypothetical protein V2I36_07900 [Desulfopila sp.]|nr:hypothetical protein [Desulfopila sp.]
MRFLYGFLFISTVLITTTIAQSATLSVPSQYSSLAAAVAAAGNGDTIEILAGAYTSGIVATISQNNLIIRGVNGKASFNADGIPISNGKAILVTTGNNITIENVAFSNTRVPDRNGAGIRHEGGLLTVRHCSFYDNENGILTSNQGSSGELVVEHSEFNHNGLGSAGYTHNIYVGHIGRFVFRYSSSHHATHGHNIKSRAAENHILYSTIMDEASGNASYQIDLPNGGLSYIIGNVIHQGISTENSTMISYGAEGGSNPIQEVYLINNTMVNDRPSISYGIRLSGSPSAVVRNNIFDNLSTAVNGVPTEYDHNFEGSSSGFINRGAFNYHLTASSPARDKGINPGTGRNVSLVPVKEYVHPLGSADRYQDSALDIGAFEYTPATPPPPGEPGTIVVPSNFLLLR